MLSRATAGLVLATRNAHPRDARIAFDEERHTYTLDGERVFGVSVTGLIKNLETESFDADAVAAKLAARPSAKYNAGVDVETQELLPLTAEAIKARWDTARDLGTDLHGKIERHLNGVEVSGAALGTNSDEFAQFERWYAGAGLRAYRTEWVIYDEVADVAGSIDFVGVNVATGGYVIVDWKRCAHGEKSFTTHWRGKCMAPPADHLPECKLSHYKVQLNVYRAILERHYGVAIEAMFIVALYPGQADAAVYPVARDVVAEAVLANRARRAAK